LTVEGVPRDEREKRERRKRLKDACLYEIVLALQNCIYCAHKTTWYLNATFTYPRVP
jgi:hypothetical protein